LREAKDEQSFWEQMASEAEAAKVALEQRLATMQAETVAQPREAVAAFVAAASTAAAAVHLDEAETRKRYSPARANSPASSCASWRWSSIRRASARQALRLPGVR
jgi:hypothetical protein